MRIEEDINEGGGDGWQRLRVQREDTETVLWALDGMHRGAGPCSGGTRWWQVKGRLWAATPPGGQPERRPGLGAGSRSTCKYLPEFSWPHLPIL